MENNITENVEQNKNTSWTLVGQAPDNKLRPHHRGHHRV